MNAATIPGALHISQNGVLVNGATQVTDNGQVIQFTPSAPFQNNALIQVFLDTTALDTDGSSLNNYQASFTTVVDTSAVAPAVVSTSPVSCCATGVPTNVVIDVGFNEALNPATVNTTAVSLQQNACCPVPVVPSTVSLVGGGTIVQIPVTLCRSPRAFKGRMGCRCPSPKIPSSSRPGRERTRWLPRSCWSRRRMEW